MSDLGELRALVADTLAEHQTHGYACSCGAELNDAAAHEADAIVRALQAAGVIAGD